MTVNFVRQGSTSTLVDGEIDCQYLDSMKRHSFIASFAGTSEVKFVVGSAIIEAAHMILSWIYP
jgi:hypothetical protein